MATVKKKDTVLKLLEGIKPGLSKSTGKGDCVKEAIRRGLLNISGTPDDLDKVVFKDFDPNWVGLSDECKCKIDVTLGMLLEEKNYYGDEYEDGLESTTIFCPNHEEEARSTISGICTGSAQRDSGKFTNHCVDGKCSKGKFGTCIYDYREAHCENCDNHYFCGNRGYNCSHCGAGDYDSDEYEDIPNLLGPSDFINAPGGPKCPIQ